MVHRGNPNNSPMLPSKAVLTQVSPKKGCLTEIYSKDANHAPLLANLQALKGALEKPKETPDSLDAWIREFPEKNGGLEH